MADQRENVANAILVAIQGMTFEAVIGIGSLTWVTTSRRLKLWGDVAPELQPAAYLTTHEEPDEYRGLGLLRRRIHYRVWCYFRTDDQTITGDTIINNMLNSFESVFPKSDNPGINQNTLGGLVYWCRLEGRVFKDPGDIDNQGVVIIPLIVEMP